MSWHLSLHGPRLVVAATCVLAGLARGPAAWADGDPFGPEVSMHAMDTAGGVVSDGAPASSTFVVDDAREVTWVLTSTEELDVTLGFPDGQSLSLAQINERRGRTWSWRGADKPELLVLPGTGTGPNVAIAVGQPARGRYVLSVARKVRAIKGETKVDANGDVPFLFTMLEDSDLRLGVWVGTPDVLVGQPVVVCAMLMNGVTPVRGAVAAGKWVGESAGDTGAFSLRDDGLGADQTAGDGIYTGIIPALSREGRVRVAVRATGATASAGHYQRAGGSVLVVSAPGAATGRRSTAGTN